MAVSQYVDCAIAIRTQHPHSRNFQPLKQFRARMAVRIVFACGNNGHVRPYRRKEILDRLQHSFGPTLIRKISYRVG